MSRISDVAMPLEPWSVIDRARGRTPSNLQGDAAREMLANIRDGDSQCDNYTELALRSLVYAIVEDSRQCFAQLRAAIDYELVGVTHFVQEVSRVIPKLVDNPKAQIVADMVMEKRYAEARALILELEDESGGGRNDLSAEQMADIVKRMQDAARTALPPDPIQNSLSDAGDNQP